MYICHMYRDTMKGDSEIAISEIMIVYDTYIFHGNFVYKYEQLVSIALLVVPCWMLLLLTPFCTLLGIKCIAVVNLVGGTVYNLKA